MKVIVKILGIGLISLIVVSCKKEAVDSSSSSVKSDNRSQEIYKGGGTEDLTGDEIFGLMFLEESDNLFNLKADEANGMSEIELITESRINIILSWLREYQIAELQMVRGNLSYTIRDLTSEEIQDWNDGVFPYPAEVQQLCKGKQGMRFANCVKDEVDARSCVKVIKIAKDTYEAYTCD
jgi:hypothetical protein